MMPTAESYFRESAYWRAWSTMPDLTADIDYALRIVRPDDTALLDVACGRGRLLPHLARVAPSARLVGLDINQDMAIQANRLAPSMVGSIYALPFGDRVFDAVLCHEAFMHFDRPGRALVELCRVSSDRVYVSVTTRRQLNTLLRACGLLASSAVPHWTYNREEIMPMLPPEFRWSITGAFLLGRKALGLSHAAHRSVHRALGRFIPQPILRTFGQSLFVYGRRF